MLTLRGGLRVRQFRRRLGHAGHFQVAALARLPMAPPAQPAYDDADASNSSAVARARRRRRQMAWLIFEKMKVKCREMTSGTCVCLCWRKIGLQIQSTTAPDSDLMAQHGRDVNLLADNSIMLLLMIVFNRGVSMLQR